jgi:hypothetical protein
MLCTGVQLCVPASTAARIAGQNHRPKPVLPCGNSVDSFCTRQCLCCAESVPQMPVIVTNWKLLLYNSMHCHETFCRCSCASEELQLTQIAVCTLDTAHRLGDPHRHLDRHGQCHGPGAGLLATIPCLCTVISWHDSVGTGSLRRVNGPESIEGQCRAATVQVQVGHSVRLGLAVSRIPGLCDELSREPNYMRPNFVACASCQTFFLGSPLFEDPKITQNSTRASV